jgi:hypothetical protein
MGGGNPIEGSAGDAHGPRWILVSSRLACWLTVSAAVAVALASAGGAAADRVHLTHADQSAAKRDVLRISDLPKTVTWKKSSYNSNGSGTPAGCSSLNYSAPAIVDTGHAQAQFTAPGVFVMNEVGLVSNTSMVHLIWKHIFEQSGMTRCIGAAFKQGGKGKVTVLSSTKLDFPNLAKLQSAYRIVFQLRVNGKKIRGAFDLVVMGGGRTISMLFVMGILGSAGQQQSGEMAMSLIDASIAQKLAGRSFSAGSSSSGLAA